MSKQLKNFFHGVDVSYGEAQLFRMLFHVLFLRLRSTATSNL